MLPFNQATYLVQVRRSRELAALALDRYPIRVKKIEFINHGENTTFRVRATGGDYLCRIHREDYHSTPAIEEELKWLEKLARDGFAVPNPLRSKKNRLIENVAHLGMGSRRVTVFHWIDGRFMSKAISEARAREIGELLGSFQNHARKIKVKHRQYWGADGLVGSKPKFGNQDAIVGATRKEQRIITETRKEVLSRVRTYQRKFPERMGLIHADLHFGNMLIGKDGRIGAIDFDDCGQGFHIYDLTAPLMGIGYHLTEAKRFREYPKMKAALIEGYASQVEWDRHDDAVLTDFLMARRLMIVGWLNARADNPRLQKRVRWGIDRALSYIADPDV